MGGIKVLVFLGFHNCPGLVLFFAGKKLGQKAGIFYVYLKRGVVGKNFHKTIVMVHKLFF